MFTIRSSRAEDIPVITKIYSCYVSHTTYTLESTPPTTVEMINRRADVLSKNMPYLVAEQADSIVGYVHCNWFKTRAAYRFSAEVSIFLDKDICGKGLGRQLLNARMHEAELVGIRKTIAVISDSKNEGSIGFHHSTHFSHVGTFKSCGWKFNRWLDMTLMEKNIGEGDTTIPPE